MGVLHTASEGTLMKERVTVVLETIVKNSWVKSHEVRPRLLALSLQSHMHLTENQTPPASRTWRRLFDNTTSPGSTQTRCRSCPVTWNFSSARHPPQVTQLKLWSLGIGTKPAAAALWLVTTWPLTKPWTRSLESIQVLLCEWPWEIKGFWNAALFERNNHTVVWLQSACG